MNFALSACKANISQGGEQKPRPIRPQGAHCGLRALCAIKISDKLSATVNKKPQNWNILILFTTNVLLGREGWTAEYYGWRGLPRSLILITNARAKLRILPVAGAAVHLHRPEISTTPPIPPARLTAVAKVITLPRHD